MFGLSRYTSLNGKFYAFVIVDDYSRFTCVLFLAHKDDVIDAFQIFYKRVQNEKAYSITCIRGDHDGKFKIMHLKIFVMTLALNINFHHLGLHNKME